MTSRRPVWAEMIETPDSSSVSLLLRQQRHRRLLLSVCVCVVWCVQGLEENLREAQGAAQRLESHLKQKEKMYEDKIKVKEIEFGGGASRW